MDMTAALSHTDAEYTGHTVVDQLETARLRLRPFTPEDLDGLCLLTGDAEVMRYIGDGKTLSREETESNLSKIIRAHRRRGFGRWALVRKDGGSLVGYCGLSHINEQVGVELVYLLSRAEWGRGFATEAARACLRYGFERLGLESIAALTRPDNLNSRRVMERLNMKYVRGGYYYGYSCVCYTITRDDWQPDASMYRVSKSSPTP
jgi:ribosomal-protein-alanine N-acetyltransferase